MTLVSVVIAVHGEATELQATLDSVLHQSHSDLECLLVADGQLADAADGLLRLRAEQDPRLRVLRQDSAGLTRALIRGCDAARGEWIARLDLGDAMQPQRLERQLAVLQAHRDCVLATSDVEVCGPRWEHLRTDAQRLVSHDPIHVDTVPPEQGIAIDIPHHASVTFRRDAYLVVGGYRSAFYFGQDWDLWYRLASVGRFVHVPEVLTRVRLFPAGLSSRHWREQRRIAHLSLACSVARRRGEPEQPFLDQAAAIRPRLAPARSFRFDARRAEGAYFIAEALRRNGDRRCLGYFREAMAHGMLHPRLWIRLTQALLTFAGMGQPHSHD